MPDKTKIARSKAFFSHLNPTSCQRLIQKFILGKSDRKELYFGRGRNLIQVFVRSISTQLYLYTQS